MIVYEIGFSDDKIIGAHAHNDYKNEYPLKTALDNKFKSIEVDVFSLKDRLYVGHSWFELRRTKTIEKMYLDPLWEIFNSNDNSIYTDNSLYLLVDVKTNALKTYKILENILTNYKPMLTHVAEDSVFEGAVTIVLSGNRPPIDYFDDYKYRNVFIDGRLHNIGEGISYKIMPLISSSWTDSFEWRGDGNFAKDQMSFLQNLIRNVHLEKKHIRFWGSPDNENAWSVLLAANIDLINTDKIEQCKKFIIKNNSKKGPINGKD